MIPRPFTCCCAILAIASGFFLYTKKHQTTLLDQQISKIVSDTQHIRAQTAMLRTEWELENQPERLKHLVEQHLTNLHAMEPTQFVRMSDLKKHLPALPSDAPSAETSPAPQASHFSVPKHTAPVVATAATTPSRYVMPPLASESVRTVVFTSGSKAVASPVRPMQATVIPAPPIRAVIRHPSAPASVVPAVHDNKYTAPAITAPQAAPPRLQQAEVRHPLPVAVASWHTPHTSRKTAQADSAGYVEARATPSFNGGSLLSRSGEEIPPPTPVAN